MSAVDPFAHDDGAYVLGALSAEDQVAFEEHLRTCDVCAEKVREIQDLPSLLKHITAEEAGATEQLLPDTLLAGLVRRAAAERRRRRWLVGGLASVAAACLVALIVVVWPSGSSPATHPPDQRAFTAVVKSPVQASAVLTSTAWGTAIDVRCRYLPGTADASLGYGLIVYGHDHTKESLGSWKLSPGRNITFPTGTWMPENQIASIEITLPDGMPILRLKN